MIDQHQVLAIVTPVDVTLDVKQIDVTLDEGWSPYCQVRLVCALPTPEDRELLDLRAEDLRLDLRITRSFGSSWTLADLTADIGGSIAALTALMAGQPLAVLTDRYHKPWNGPIRAGVRRTFALTVTDRDLDDNAKELVLLAASDEALLQRDALVSTTPWDPGTTSLLAIAAGVLERYGATLHPDSVDATVAEADATIWRPGVGAWSYLDSMLEAASLRLWCDEFGEWRIAERQAVVPGAVTITPDGSMTNHRDRMTLDPEVWADAVVVEYRWVDEFDLNRIAYDAAGAEPAKAVLVVHRTTAYPGPGAAAGILARMAGRGRVLDVAAISDYTVTPGMAATISPPETIAQTGYVSAVTWRLPDAEMDVVTRGLVDTPPTSWLFAPPGVSWDDVPEGMAWTEYDPELIGA